MAKSVLPPLAPNAWLRWDRVSAVLDGAPAVSAEQPLGDILEIGTGQGGVGSRLALRGRYVGVDLDATSVATARARLTAVGAHDAQLLQGPLDEVLEPERRFDLVCAFEVLEHIEDDAGALQAWAARLRPGGRMLLSVPADPGRYSSADRMAGHFRRYTDEAMRTVLASAGLENAEVQHYGAGLGNVLEHGRNFLARRRGFDSSPPTADDATTALAAATGASGRLFQPPQSLSLLTQAGTFPFRRLQRLAPGRGPGLVATATRPA